MMKKIINCKKVKMTYCDFQELFIYCMNEIVTGTKMNQNFLLRML